MKLLVCRTDRLGDLVLSLPVFARLKAARHEAEIHALIAPGSAPLVEHDPGVDRVLAWDPAAAPLAGAMLGAVGYDAAVMLVYDRAVAWTLRRAGVAPLVGPLSRPTSWLLLRGGVRQRRSRAERHERDYNLDLAAALIARVGGDPGAGGWDPLPRLHRSTGQIEAGRRFRAEAAGGAEVVAFVHPGMGGSALNWPPEKFASTAAELAARPGWRVFLTGGESDRPVTSRVAALAGEAVTDLTGAFDLRGLIGVLGGGDLIVAPSTGPLHIGAALGLAAVGVYPPLRVQSPRRWGPLGPRAKAVGAGVECPEGLRCRGDRCEHWNCVRDIPVQAVIAAADAALAAGTESRDRKE